MNDFVEFMHQSILWAVIPGIIGGLIGWYGAKRDLKRWGWED